MLWLSGVFQSGSKTNSHLVADNQKELERAAKKLHAEIHGKGNQARHLDLNAHQRELAVRYGAAETARRG